MATEHVDVLVVGAGLSGIAAGYYLQTLCPGRRYAILEARDRIGGTWDLFRYPGVRSDSDMFTLEYSFRPWDRPEAIAEGPAIREYIVETAEALGIDEKVRFQHRVRRAVWEREAALNDEGLVNDVVIVNGELVCRFARHGWGVDDLRQEARCLALAGRHVAMRVPEWTWHDDDFISYELIRGAPLQRYTILEADEATRQGLAEQVGTLLWQMHTIPMGEVEAQGIEPSVTNRTSEAWLEMYAAVDPGQELGEEVGEEHAQPGLDIYVKYPRFQSLASAGRNRRWRTESTPHWLKWSGEATSRLAPG